MFTKEGANDNMEVLSDTEEHNNDMILDEIGQNEEFNNL